MLACAAAILAAPAPVASAQQSLEDELAQPPAENRLAAGIPVTATLQITDPQLRDNSFYQDWLFDGRAGQTAVVRMNSTEFDTYLHLGRYLDGRFVRLAHDDDGGTGTNSRIRYRLPLDGEYVVRANSYAGGVLGSYTLRLDLN